MDAVKNFDIDEIKYDYETRRTADEFEGIIVRIVDDKGNVVAEHREGASSIKTKSWDEKKDGSKGAVIVNPLGN